LDRPEPVPQVVDAQTYPALVTAANALGELAARENAEARYPAEREANEVYDQVREAVVEIRAAIAAATARARAPVIAVIRKGSDFGHAAKYLFGPGERGEHVDAHVMAGGRGRASYTARVAQPHPVVLAQAPSRSERPFSTVVPCDFDRPRQLVPPNQHQVPTAKLFDCIRGLRSGCCWRPAQLWWQHSSPPPGSS
jgi:hypothetical protein